jgi:hypothetical protein
MNTDLNQRRDKFLKKGKPNKEKKENSGSRNER